MEVRRGDPRDNVPGKAIVIPERFEQLHVTEMSLDRMKRSYIKNVVQKNAVTEITADELDFLAEDSRQSREAVIRILTELGVKVHG